MRTRLKRIFGQACILACIFLSSCNNYFKNDYVDNSPTSGKLKVYYDEGLRLHVRNQTQTFESQYPRATVELIESSESAAVQALFNDSCEAIVISRLLNEQERRAFQTKKYDPKYTAVAKTGVAILTNYRTPIDQMTVNDIRQLLTQSFEGKDSTGTSNPVKAVLDKNNSAVLHYLSDSLLRGKPFSPSCNSLSGSLEAINYVARHKYALAFIDFGWLSDVDDSIYKANQNLVKFIAIAKEGNSTFEYPNQSSFKLNTYAFTRTVYVMRKTGDFTLAKGYESYIAGPKGQLTFLKQGLLPNRQSERNIKANTQ